MPISIVLLFIHTIVDQYDLLRKIEDEFLDNIRDYLVELEQK